MNAALTEFLSAIDDLRHYAKGIELEWQLLAQNPTTSPSSEVERSVGVLKAHVGIGANKRRFDYNSLVISLYGILERYVEQLVSSYVRQLNSIVPTVGGLPEAIRGSHMELSIQLVNRLEQNRYRGVLTADQIITGLYTCIGNAGGYQLNSDAFAIHTANLWSDSIDAVFMKVGIPNVMLRLRHYSALRKFLESEHATRDPDGMSREEICNYLDDLVERRNEVAHGSVTQLLSYEILENYVAYIRAIGESLWDAVNSELLRYVARHRGTPIGSAIAVYNSEIVCVEISGIALSVGDRMVAETNVPERPFVGGEILELQVDKVAYECVDATQNAKRVGIRVGFRAKMNHHYYVIPS